MKGGSGSSERFDLSFTDQHREEQMKNVRSWKLLLPLAALAAIATIWVSGSSAEMTAMP